jgi:thiosulfate reductase/polysulfide reductase chain A
MARELAKRLGVIDYFPFEKIEDQLDWQLKQVGSSLEEIDETGSKDI